MRLKPWTFLLALAATAAFEPAAECRPHASAHRAKRLRVRRAIHEAANTPNISAAVPIVPPLPRAQLTLTPSYFDEHAERVRHDMVAFDYDAPGQNPLVHPSLIAEAPRQQIQFVARRDMEDPLAVEREREHLLVLRDRPAGQGEAVAVGLAMFMTATVAAAHAPGPLRSLFDSASHVGPALFQGGGMGAGAGGSWR